MIVLYSNHCPNCSILKAELQKAGIEYEECNDIDTMINMGLNEMPMLGVNGKLLTLQESISWIKKGAVL